MHPRPPHDFDGRASLAHTCDVSTKGEVDMDVEFHKISMELSMGC